MPQNYAGSHWRQSIYNDLRKRNNREFENIKDLIQSFNRLFDNSENLRNETKQLNFQNEKLREELLQNQDGKAILSCATTVTTSSVSVQKLEQKIYKLQEEVTELHRRRSENSQQLVELNQCLQERDKILATLQNKLAEKESELMLANESVESKDAKVQDVEAINQLLRDEYQALNLIYNSLEEKYNKATEEIQELVKRWMILKEKDAEKLNQENEAVSKKRQEALERNLKEACLEHRVVREDDKYGTASPCVVSCALPAKPYITFEAHEGEVTALIFSSQGRFMATGGSDRKIKLWDVSQGTADCRGVLMGSNASVTALATDAEERLLVGASSDFACRVWTPQDQRLRHTLTGHSRKVTASRFWPTEPTKLVTGSADCTLKVWDLRSRSCIKTYFPGSSCNDVVTCSAVAPGAGGAGGAAGPTGASAAIASAHFDKTVKLYDSRKDDPASVVGLAGKVTSLALSPDGFYLLCSVRDDTLRLLDLRMCGRETVCRTMSAEGFRLGADVARAALSPDGELAACGGHAGSIFIWDVATGQLLKELKDEHTACVMACCWHPSGKMFASCDKNKTVIIWSDF